MRVLVVGGAGEMGRQASRTISRLTTVKTVIVADLHAKAAEAVAAEIQDDPYTHATVQPASVDLTRRAELDAAMRAADIVVNTAGPFFRFGVDVLSAAIDAGKDYVDLCDDPEPTLAMLGLDQRARDKGITALIGMGASPGVANLLAVLAARELDSVETIITGWNIDDATADSESFGKPTAALIHGIEQISGTIPEWTNGRLSHRSALERVVIEYPGLGRFYGYTFGHPEAVTLNRAIEARRSINVVVGSAPTLKFLRFIRSVVDQRLLSPRYAARAVAVAQSLKPTATPADLLTPGGPPPLFAVATGRRRGVPVTAATALAGTSGWTMAANTGVPLAVSVPFVASSREFGVHTPETLIEPSVYFAALADHCIGHPRAENMAVTTRSWASDEENRMELNKSLITALLAPR